MALYTSVQSGPFDVASTWDLNTVPGDGDQFNINYGHNVAVTGDIRPTNGFDNSNVYGKLHIQGSGCYLRMNGNLIVRNDNNYGQFFVEGQNSGGFFRMDPGSTLEMRGTNDDQHKLYLYSSNDRYVRMEIEGTNPNPKTTLSADADNHATTMSFTDASDFRNGDYIAVYKTVREGYDQYRYKSDEAFWIHDIDNNTVYFRHFVSPTATIQAFSGNRIVVDDADVFRKNQKIIFGTGSNRNVKTIINIGYGSNTILLDSNVSGSVVGEQLYRTGIEKQHFSGDDVLRMAAVLTENSDAGSNTITVNNTNGFSVGDLIMISNNDPDHDTNDTWDSVQDYTITNINTSTNVITFTSGYTSSSQTTLPYNAKTGIGSIIVNLSRDTKITGPSDTSYNDGSLQGSFIYRNNVGNANDYYCVLKIKNTFINLGPNNKNTTYGSISLQGHLAYSDLAYSGEVSEFEGNVITPTTRLSIQAMYQYRQHFLNYRNNVFYNTYSWAIYNNDYNQHTSYYNNIFCRTSVLRKHGHREYYEDTCYNYGIRLGNFMYFYNMYGTPQYLYSNYGLFMTGRPMYGERGVSYLNIKKCYFDYFKIWPYAYYSGSLITNNCWFGNKWDVTGDNGSNSKYLDDTVDITRVSYSDYYRNFNVDHTKHLNANFKKDFHIISNNSALKYWDKDERAWRVYIDQENSRNGILSTFYIPDNSVVRIKIDVKCHSSLTNYPELFLQGLSSMTRGFQTRKDLSGGELNSQDPSDAAEITEYTGFRDWIPYTAASKIDYETKTAVVPAFPFSYWLAVGVLVNNGGSGNAHRGWWEKDIVIKIENPTDMQFDPDINLGRTRKSIGNSLTETRTIWGG